MRKRKFNLFGLGEGGSSIAEEVFKKMSYHDISLSFINTATQDLEKHKTHETLLLEGEGTGKRISKGLQITSKYSERIESFVESVVGEKEVDFHMIIACLGGGSGATIFDKVITSLPTKDKIVAVLVLPELLEGIPANPNSFINLQRIYLKHTPKIDTLILVDNEELFKSFSKTVDTSNYYDKANEFLAHRLNSIFSLAGFASQTHLSVDNNEVDEVLFSGDGCFKCHSIQFEKFKEETIEDIFKHFETVDTNIFQAGNWRTTKKVLVFIEYKNKEQVDMKKFLLLEEKIKKVIKNAYFIFSTKSSKDFDLAYAITIFANGLDLPKKRIGKISRKAKQSLLKLREKDDRTKDREIFKNEKEFNFKF